MLHEGDAAALDRIGDDDLRLPGMRFAGAQRRREGIEVVAVAALDMPAEAFELGWQVAEIAGLADAIVRLQLVVIDDRRDLAHTSIGGRDQRLPDLALLQLAVAGQDVIAAFVTSEAVG